SDLNKVAVLINKAMVEILPRFAEKALDGFAIDRGIIEEKKRQTKGAMLSEFSNLETLREHYTGARGLAEDVRYYGQWMRDEAFRRIGHLYPQIEITSEMVAERPDLESYRGEKLTVIAWLWARTVRSPNPAFSHVD